MIRAFAFGCAALLTMAWSCEASAAGRLGHGLVRGRVAARQAATMPWHGYHYKPQWGMPLAMAVPPTAGTRTHWGWGVGNTRTTPIGHQYGPHWPGPGVYDRRSYRQTPPWPTDTDQMGVYYIRGPW